MSLSLSLYIRKSAVRLQAIDFRKPQIMDQLVHRNGPMVFFQSQQQRLKKRSRPEEKTKRKDQHHHAGNRRSKKKDQTLGLFVLSPWSCFLVRLVFFVLPIWYFLSDYFSF
jgi:hypothetical protein